MKELLNRGATSMGLTLSCEQINAFILYYDELKKWSSKINISALVDNEKKVVCELFLDSLAPLLVIGKENCHERHLLDVGSGGGFPGIPIKIAFPALNVTLCDSIEKKVFFMRNVIRKLSLTGIEAITCKFNDLGSTAIEKASYGWAISKAVTDIETFALWAAPHLKKGGILICMKGPKEEAIELKNYSSPEKINYTLPLLNLKRRLYLYQKL
ncbi:MAG: 16S rRNA (guanine(527)-N(7))-methyltransferase RsmG [Proteobacteria bacterium]|nr:16S rRNA (guanine(527)-N(7))-methyltransferase RsmG [Pseudomonadota bacterium]